MMMRSAPFVFIVDSLTTELTGWHVRDLLICEIPSPIGRWTIWNFLCALSIIFWFPDKFKWLIGAILCFRFQMQHFLFPWNPPKTGFNMFSRTVPVVATVTQYCNWLLGVWSAPRRKTASHLGICLVSHKALTVRNWLPQSVLYVGACILDWTYTFGWILCQQCRWAFSFRHMDTFLQIGPTRTFGRLFLAYCKTGCPCWPAGAGSLHMCPQALLQMLSRTGPFTGMTKRTRSHWPLMRHDRNNSGHSLVDWNACWTGGLTVWPNWEHFISRSLLMEQLGTRWKPHCRILLLSLKMMTRQNCRWIRHMRTRSICFRSTGNTHVCMLTERFLEFSWCSLLTGYALWKRLEMWWEMSVFWSFFVFVYRIANFVFQFWPQGTHTGKCVVLPICLPGLLLPVLLDLWIWLCVAYPICSLKVCFRFLTKPGLTWDCTWNFQDWNFDCQDHWRRKPEQSSWASPVVGRYADLATLLDLSTDQRPGCSLHCLAVHGSRLRCPHYIVF